MSEFATDNTVIGYFSSEADAESAVRELREAGFTRDQISLAGRPDTEAYSSGTSTGTSTESAAHQTGRKAGEEVGGFWHRVKGFFEGEGAEPYAEEPTRGEMATREVTTSDDVYDYDADDFHQSWGVGSDDRSRYFTQQYGRTGQGIIVTVYAGDRRDEAEDILDAHGADLGDEADTEVTATPELTGTSVGSETSTGSYASQNTDLQSPRRIQLYGEVLRVHRDRVQRGEARLRKETITETQTVQVPVTREELVIERTPVSGERPATGATVGSENEEIRIPLSEERVRVEKEPVVREQVNVGKREISNTETRQETVKREELRVDKDDEQYRKAS